jgi:cleavage stimulation factor subunit 2
MNGRLLRGRELRVSSADKNGVPAAPPSNVPAGATPVQLIESAINKLKDFQLWDIVAEMKTFIDENPDEARKVLMENPPLAQAILMAQLRLIKAGPGSAPAPVAPSRPGINPSQFNGPVPVMGGPNSQL